MLDPGPIQTAARRDRQINPSTSWPDGHDHAFGHPTQPHPPFQWAASNASWIVFGIRPREDTSYPADLAHTRIAWICSR